jgi:hypothetical protein
MQDFSERRDDGVGRPLEELLRDSSSRQALIKDILKRFEDANLASEAARDRIACEITEILNG